VERREIRKRLLKQLVECTPDHGANYIQIPFVDGVVEEMLGGFEATGVVASSPLDSPLIVEVEDDRPKLVRGARCVSFNSEAYAFSHCFVVRSPGRG
jgi:hypothetical protein